MKPGDFPEAIDSSMVATFKSCPQLFKKIYIDLWKPKEGANVHLVAGGAFAKGAEVARLAFYEGVYDVGVVTKEGKREWRRESLPARASHETAVALGLQALMFHYGDFQCPADSAKSLERTMGALEYYFERFPMNDQNGYPKLLPNGRRAIEISFASPIEVAHPVTHQPILYVGRADTITHFAGAAYIEDDKTTTSLGASWGRQWELRSQFIGYTYFFRRILPFRIAGALVRGVSILKTKYDSAEQPVNFDDFQCNRWYEELCEWVEDMKIAWANNRWRYNLDHTCANYGGCGFLTVCKSQDETPFLETYFERRHWDPVTRVETKL